MDPLYAREIGVDIDELLVSQPDYGEQALEVCDMLVRSGAVDVVALDSVAALTPRVELEGQMGDQTVGLQARMMSQAMRKLAGNLNRTQTLCLFTNQIREKVGVMFGSPETQPGGRALKFYASQRLDIRRIETLKEGTEAVGNRVRVKVVKNKVAAPFRQAEFDIEFGKGISTSGCLLDLGVEHNVVSKSGSFFSYKGERLGQGRNNSKAFLDEHQEVAKAIETEVWQALGLGPDLVVPIERAAPTWLRRRCRSRSASAPPRRSGGLGGRRATGDQANGRSGQAYMASDERALDLAVGHLGKRDRTAAEVRRHLLGKDISEPAADAAVAELERMGYLDDARYARVFAEDRRTLDAWGPERIERRLLELGVDREHVAAALGERDGAGELEAALELLRRRLRESPPASASATARWACSCARATTSSSPTTRCGRSSARTPSEAARSRNLRIASASQPNEDVIRGRAQGASAAGRRTGRYAVTAASATTTAGGAPETELSARFADALVYATRVHQAQTRRGRPYMAHLLRVAGLVLDDGGSEDEAIAALLHDAAEDQGGYRRLRDIRVRYGDDVAAIVDSCTDTYEEPKPAWRTRKEQYLEHIADSSPSALRVSIADKVDNASSILTDLASHPDAASDDVCWYYASLAGAFRELRPGPMADELGRLANEMSRRHAAADKRYALAYSEVTNT